jgi:alkyl hydroperoxide reductase subunit AhpF
VNDTLEQRADAIRAWNDALPEVVDLHLVRTGDERSSRIEAFLNELAERASNVRVHPETGEPGALPGIRIPPSWTIYGVPEGTELDPFLELLSRTVTGEAGVSDGLRTALEGVGMPSLVDLYVATQCPNCPRVLARIAPFPLVNSLIRVRVFDGVLFSERAQEHGIRAVPTVLLADGLRYTGQVRAEEVAEGLLQGDPSLMQAEAFARMLQAGDAQGLAGMMLQRRQVFPGVLDLLAGDLFSLRLGAMVAMEEIGEKDPDLARQGLELLWERMEGADPSARGDIVYLVGELGDASWRPRLQGLLEREVPQDLREAVQEALESLEE